MRQWTEYRAFSLRGAIALAACALLGVQDAPQRSVIVQASDVRAATESVQAVGGEITHELAIIGAVAARLTSAQIETLERDDGVRIAENGSVEVAGKPTAPDTGYPTVIGATALHEQGITGRGVGVAVLDTGTFSHAALNKDTSGDWRYIAQYDALTDTLVASLPPAEMSKQNSGVGIYDLDDSGHGTHVSSVIVSSANAEPRGSRYGGVAPDAYLVTVRAFDTNGAGTYADVIRGIDWVVAHRDTYAIRVLNCSFSTPPQTRYWNDPLNQAVMRAWQAGITVVASAGNNGPGAMTIGVPGNVPYVITVGAMTDRYTPLDPSDDVLARFSSTGPTAEGFVKPEIVAPGGHMLALMEGTSTIAVEHRDFHDGGAYFTMSGTSQAAAVVSGVVALMLQSEPFLTPDDVKCKLMSSARTAVDANDQLACSIFQQGAGVVDAEAAVGATDLTCANNGLNIDRDLAGEEHYRGRANVDENGVYYIEGLPGYTRGDGFMFSDGFFWSDGFVFSDGFFFSDAFVFSGAHAAAVNSWVDQE